MGTPARIRPPPPTATRPRARRRRALRPRGTGDWQVRCLPVDEGEEPCQIYQLLLDSDENTVSEVTIVPLPAGADAAAGAVFVVPLETQLDTGLIMSIDGGEARPTSTTSATAAAAWPASAFRRRRSASCSAARRRRSPSSRRCARPAGDPRHVAERLHRRPRRGASRGLSSPGHPQTRSARPHPAGALRFRLPLRRKMRIFRSEFFDEFAPRLGRLQRQHRVQPAEGEGVGQRPRRPSPRAPRSAPRRARIPGSGSS